MAARSVSLAQLTAALVAVCKTLASTQSLLSIPTSAKTA